MTDLLKAQRTSLSGADFSSVAQLFTSDLWPSLKAKQWVEEFVDSTCSNNSILAVVVLGSMVRPVEYAADVDILYIYDGDTSLVDDSPMDVDVRGYKRVDVEGLLSEGHELLSWALKYGYLVCEQGHFWTHLQEIWLQALPLPSTTLADERASRAAQLYDELSAIGDEDAAAEMLVSMLTHQARAQLIRAGIYPASRPELPHQLRSIGAEQLAKRLDDVLEQRRRTLVH